MLNNSENFGKFLKIKLLRQDVSKRVQQDQKVPTFPPQCCRTAGKKALTLPFFTFLWGKFKQIFVT